MTKDDFPVSRTLRAIAKAEQAERKRSPRATVMSAINSMMEEEDHPDGDFSVKCGKDWCRCAKGE